MLVSTQLMDGGNIDGEHNPVLLTRGVPDVEVPDILRDGDTEETVGSHFFFSNADSHPSTLFLNESCCDLS